MSSLARERLLGALELRYDYHSARAVLGNALTAAGIGDKAEFPADEIAALCDVLAQDPRSAAIVERLRRWSGLESSPEPAAKPAEVATPVAPQPPPAPPRPVEAAPTPQPVPSPPPEPERAAPVATAVAAPAEPEPAVAAPVVTAPSPLEVATPVAPQPPEPVAPGPLHVEVALEPQVLAAVPGNLTGAGIHADTGEPELPVVAPNEHDVAVEPNEATALRGAHVEGHQIDGDIDLVVRLAGVPPEDGAMVVMVGNLPVLGEWMPDGGVMLEPSDTAWTAQIQVPVGSVLEFKFVRIGEDASLWEGGPNRSLAIAAGTKRLETTWQE